MQLRITKLSDGFIGAVYPHKGVNEATYTKRHHTRAQVRKAVRAMMDPLYAEEDDVVLAATPTKMVRA